MPCRCYGGEEYSSYSVTSALDGVQVVSVMPRPHFTPWERIPSTRWIGS
jgi:hypothetical protein